MGALASRLIPGECCGPRLCFEGALTRLLLFGLLSGNPGNEIVHFMLFDLTRAIAIEVFKHLVENLILELLLEAHGLHILNNKSARFLFV